MKYKIIKRIQNGQSTVGFQLLSEDKKILNIPKDQVIRAAYQGLVVNAIYNKHTKSISGVAGTDLRGLPVIQYSEILGSKSSNTSKNSNQPKQTDSKCKTNHELAKEYILKQKHLGKNLIKVELLPNDKVKLLEVLDKASTGTFILPSFITEHYIDWDDAGMKEIGPFRGCKFTEVIINHDYLNWKSLFSSMESKVLSVKNKGKPVENLHSSFSFCTKLQKLDLSNVDTANVTDMGGMFYRCLSLKQVDLSRFDTRNVTNMHEMFYFCSSLKQLDIRNFDTHNVTGMCSMFECCSSLQQLDLSNFDTHNVTNMAFIFSCCESLQQLNISSFNTHNVTNMKNMFEGCSSLQQLDLSNFDTSNTEDMRNMFYGCSSLKSIRVREDNKLQHELNNSGLGKYIVKN